VVDCDYVLCFLWWKLLVSCFWIWFVCLESYCFNIVKVIVVLLVDLLDCLDNHWNSSVHCIDMCVRVLKSILFTAKCYLFSRLGDLHFSGNKVIGNHRSGLERTYWYFISCVCVKIVAISHCPERRLGCTWRPAMKIWRNYMKIKARY